MLAVAERRPMARRKAPPPSAPVRVDQDVIDLCNIVAAYRRVTLTAYVSQVLREQARKDHEEEVAKLKKK